MRVSGEQSTCAAHNAVVEGVAAVKADVGVQRESIDHLRWSARIETGRQESWVKHRGVGRFWESSEMLRSVGR